MIFGITNFEKERRESNDSPWLYNESEKEREEE
jgi:hypothetical protein